MSSFELTETVVNGPMLVALWGICLTFGLLMFSTVWKDVKGKGKPRQALALSLVMGAMPLLGAALFTGTGIFTTEHYEVAGQVTAKEYPDNSALPTIHLDVTDERELEVVHLEPFEVGDQLEMTCKSLTDGLSLKCRIP